MDKDALARFSHIELGGARASLEPLGTVGMPVRDQMNIRTVISVLLTDWPQPIDQLFAGGNVLTLQRNNLIGRMRGEWILFIDDDMVWRPDAVKKLLAGKAELEEMGHEVDVIGALCFKRASPHEPTMLTIHESGAYNYVEDWDTDIVEVDATGLAFALITKKAFERIAGTEMPPYEVRAAHSKTPDFFRWSGSLGEDLRFCQDVRKAGGKVFVDTRVVIDHMSEQQIGYRDFLRGVMERSDELDGKRRTVNDMMDLPTLDRAEARRRYDDIP